MVDEFMKLIEEPLKRIVKKAVAEAVNESLPNAMKDMEKPYLTVDEAAEISGLSKRSLQHLRDSNQISYIRSGKRRILIPRREFIEYLESRKFKIGSDE